MLATSLPPTHENWETWVIVRHPRTGRWGRTSLILTLLICTCSSSPEQQTHATSLQCSVVGRPEIAQTGLLPRAQPGGHGAAPSPLFSDVLCICTAPSLPTAEACANGLINLTPWEETQGVWWTPLCKGLLRFQEAKDLQAGPPWTHWLRKETLQMVWPVFKMELPLSPNCKVTVS